MAATSSYGRWASPLAASDVARAKVSLSELCSDGHALFWLESRPAEAGRVVMVRCTGDRPPADHSPPGVSIRSRVHEYGGGAVCLVPGHADGAFAYVDQADQRVWFCDGPAAGGPDAARPRPLTPGPPPGTELRHGGLGATADGEWVLAVRETHREGAPRPARGVVALPTRRGASESTLLEGHDFYGAPRVEGTGGRLAVVVWDHPDMPWDASALVVVSLVGAERSGTGGEEATLTAGPPVTVAGGPAESVGQPAWQDDGSLRFVSDRSGWWQTYVQHGPFDVEAPAAEPVAPSAVAPMRRRPSTTVPIGSSGRGPWPSGPIAAWSPAARPPAGTRWSSSATPVPPTSPRPPRCPNPASRSPPCAPMATPWH